MLLVVGCSSTNRSDISNSSDIVNLQVINTIGPDIGSSRSLNSPKAITVNQSGDIFIADFGNDRIVKLDSTYRLIKEVGGFGSGDYSFNGPIDLALDKVSNLYVADYGNSRIIRLDRQLNFSSSEYGYIKDERVDFIRPISIGITDRNEIIVGDEGLAACFKLDQFFAYQFEFGTLDEIYSVVYPSSVCYKNGTIYVCDPEYGYLFTYDEFGMFNGTFGEEVLSEPVSVAVSGKNEIWVVDRKSATLHLFNRRGKELFRWSGAGMYRLYRPSDIFVDSNNLIYLVDSQASRILILRPLMGN